MNDEVDSLLKDLYDSDNEVITGKELAFYLSNYFHGQVSIKQIREDLDL